MSVAFTVEGPIPSKSNFRRGGKDWRARWSRIVQYEQLVGLQAMVAGAKRHAGKGKATVRVLLVNQRLDIDNALKAPLDGLRGVAFADDSPEHLEAIQVCQARDDGPVRAEYRITWGGAA